VFRRRRASIAAETRRELARVAGALPGCVPSSASWSSSIPAPRLSAHKEEREDPEQSSVGTRPPGRWGNAQRGSAPALQSKPVTHASRLVAHVAPSVAFGLGVRILGRRASSCSTVLLFERLCERRVQKLARTRVGRPTAARLAPTRHRPTRVGACAAVVAESDCDLMPHARSGLRDRQLADAAIAAARRSASAPALLMAEARGRSRGVS
jgi:hypothetical protein